MPSSNDKTADRRQFLVNGARVAGALGLVGGVGYLAGNAQGREELVWQLDPDKCIACGNCATKCVLDISAVKCVNCFHACGYCNGCTGYFEKVEGGTSQGASTSAENQLCPTGAIERKFIEKRSTSLYFEYTIIEPLCIGCGKCVEGCAKMNGSMYLQVMHNRCLNCNECSIAVACPTQAFRRIPASTPNMMKKIGIHALKAIDKLPPEIYELPEEEEA